MTDRQTDRHVSFITMIIPSVKRQVFCVGDRLKMDKHKAWASTIVAPKLVGSSTTKGQMKPTFWVSLTVSQAGENGQINTPKHTNVSRILTYLTFRRNQGRRTALSGPTIESAKQPNSSNKFQNSNSTQYHHKLPTQNFNLRFLLKVRYASGYITVFSGIDLAVLSCLGPSDAQALLQPIPYTEDLPFYQWS